MPKTRNQEIVGNVDPRNPAQLSQFTREAAHCIQHLYAEAYATAAAQAGDVRTVTIQVRDRRLAERDGRWIVLIWIADTTGGPPQAVQTVTFNSGEVLSELLANGMWIVTTENDGSIELDIDVTGAHDRYVETAVLGRIRESAAFAWT